jgi:ATP:ADP antiporter, AAA family
MFSFFKIKPWQEKFFTLCVMACIFLISCEYGVTRPACNSIFISTYTASWIPYAWVVSLPLNFLFIFLYNRFLPKLGCWKMFVLIQTFVVFVNTLGGFGATSIPFFPFFQTVWKDFYILLMFKQVWSLIHTTIPSSRAKILYGIIAGMGGVGSVLGGVSAHLLAVPLGSQNLFFFTLPIYFLLFFFYRLSLRFSQVKEPEKLFVTEESEKKSAFSLIRESRPLLFILLIVVFMQLSTSLIDFQLNLFLEKKFPLTDLRTQYYGKLIWIINALTALFQFGGGLVIIHFFGTKRCHLFIPLLLLCNGLFLFFVPAFAIVSYAFISIKTLDYSLFGIVREMLYIPLNVKEKFQAKAVIDVFAYRAARGIGSFLILLLQLFTAYLPFLLSLSSILIFFFWLFIVFKLNKTNGLSEKTPAIS